MCALGEPIATLTLREPDTGIVAMAPGAPWGLDTPAEVVVPAAVADTFTVANAAAVKAEIVLEASNLPVTPEAEGSLHARRGSLGRAAPSCRRGRRQRHPRGARGGPQPRRMIGHRRSGRRHP